MRTTRVADGTRVAYRRFGVRGGPAVVLCDGISCDGFIWRHLEPLLARRADVLHVNYRGHGRSGLPRDPHAVTLPHLAGDIDFVMGRLGLGPAFVLGHSMGVQVALELAWRHPDRVRAGALICGSYGRVLDTFKGSDVGARVLPYLDRLVQMNRPLVMRTMRALMPTSLAWWIARASELKGDRITKRDFMPYLEHFSRMPVDLFTRVLADAQARSSLAWLPRLEQPFLVLAGAADTLTPPSTSRTLAEHLPNAELCVIEGASHTGLLEAPGPFNAAIMEFCRVHALLDPAPDASTSDRERYDPTRRWRERVDAA